MKKTNENGPKLVQKSHKQVKKVTSHKFLKKVTKSHKLVKNKTKNL